MVDYVIVYKTLLTYVHKDGTAQKGYLYDVFFLRLSYSLGEIIRRYLTDESNEIVPHLLNFEFSPRSGLLQVYVNGELSLKEATTMLSRAVEDILREESHGTAQVFIGAVVGIRGIEGGY